MRSIILFTFLFTTISVIAQTGIGTTSPDHSAKLDVTSTNKGFLPPRVSLTATNSASPITNPANGLLVFNTVTSGVNPYQVVPGYYYWDATGLQWVSISTTVGNVQNQAILRSTSNTNASLPVSTWNSRFNNIASGDLTINSNTSFTLSNGIYKIEWALPHQSYNTYNTIQLQEFTSGTWNTYRNDAGFANLSNGGNTDWGGGTYAADVLDCTSGSRTIRIINNDGASRTLFYGVTLIITKLNPSITTSTTADNLGNHTATKNISLNGSYLSNDGGNEGIRIDNTGNVSIGNTSPTVALDVTGDTKVSGVLTAGGNSYPTNTGTNGYALTTNASGAASWNAVPPVGVITAYAGTTAPTGYLICDGAQVSRTTYAALFAIIGTTYGAGNGSTTFNLPDLTGRVPVGKNAGTFSTLGAKAGEENHTMTINEMPAHKHTTSVNSAGDENSIGGYAPNSQSLYFGTDRAGATRNWDTAMQSTGGGAAFNVLQPYTVINYIIKF